MLDHFDPDDGMFTDPISGTSGEVRHSFWRRTLSAARTSGDWHRVDKLYTRNTAAQVASDIRRAHLDHRRKVRIRGVRRDEQWEARWNPVAGGADGDCEVWIRRVDSTSNDV
jgi:hypothetical protein